MHSATDAQQLTPCLTKIIELTEKYLEKFKSLQKQSQADIKDDNLLQNSQLNNNIYTFLLKNEENELLDTLTFDITTTINQHLLHQSSISQNYLFDFLYTYHYDRKKGEFTSSLVIGEIYSFQRELKALLASLEAFPAAYNGQIDVVKNFIQQYPIFKDKPGLWGTTLLYSAARNNHLDIIKYLIEEGYCSVNAQNQRELGFALNTSGETFVHQPTAGSTALHGACFNNHLNIVKYLVEHGADYFIQNQAYETPIINGESHSDIKKYFQDYLILTYVQKNLEDLPHQPIMNDNRRSIPDGMWEYKPFRDPKWYPFSGGIAKILQQALLPTEEFEQQIYLNTTRGLYSVSMIEFYRSGRHEQDPQANMAWIRCRGSSFLNFDCYSIWQMMFIEHHTTDQDAETISSLKVQHFPTIANVRFKIHLNTWYSCDAKTSSLLDDSMNYRRKVISINIPLIGDGLKFNLQTFEFSNNEKTISGCIRWIPKLISGTDKNKGKLVYVDNYQPMTKIKPIPLTTEYSREVGQIKYTDQQQTDHVVNEENEDDDGGLQVAMAVGMGNDEEGDDDDVENANDKNEKKDENTGTWSILELNDESIAVNVSSNPSAAIITTTNTLIREDSDISTDNFFHENIGEHTQSTVIERNNPTLKDETNAALTAQLQSEIEQLKCQIEKEKLKVEEPKQSSQTNKLVEQLQQRLLSRQTHVEQLKDLIKQIKAIDYENVESILVNSFLFGRTAQIVNYLKIKHQMDDYFAGIPTVTILERNNSYCISVTGVQAHHDEVKLVLRRIQKLSNITRSAKDYYQGRLNATLRSITHIITRQIHSSQGWICYIKFFQQLITNKIQEFVRLYDEYILHKAKGMVEQCITDASFRSSTELRKLTNLYMKMKQFEPEIELLKYEALDEYIKQHVLSERFKFAKKPSKNSLQTMNEFIDKVKKELKTNPIYIGRNVEQLKEIPKLLQSIILYYRCFLLQLPLYQSSKELLDKIENNTVITIETSTGSGKNNEQCYALSRLSHREILMEENLK